MRCGVRRVDERVVERILAAGSAARTSGGAPRRRASPRACRRSPRSRARRERRGEPCAAAPRRRRRTRPPAATSASAGAQPSGAGRSGCVICAREERGERHERHAAERALLRVEAEERRDEARASGIARRAAARARASARSAPSRAEHVGDPDDAAHRLGEDRARREERAGEPRRARGRLRRAGSTMTQTSAPFTPWRRTLTQWWRNGVCSRAPSAPERAPDEVGDRPVRADAAIGGRGPRSRGGTRRSSGTCDVGSATAAHVRVREQRLLLVEDEVGRREVTARCERGA